MGYHRLILEKDGSLGAKYIHGTIHLATDFKRPGALDLCVDNNDRLYALTEMGIQTVRSYGIIDVILNAPEGEPVSITIENDELYVKTDEGISARKIKGCMRDNTPSTPKFRSYYD